jgi:DNA-binding transcriptional LysR family regulator
MARWIYGTWIIAPARCKAGSFTAAARGAYIVRSAMSSAIAG